jgi:hypothetical protein
MLALKTEETQSQISLSAGFGVQRTFMGKKGESRKEVHALVGFSSSRGGSSFLFSGQNHIIDFTFLHFVNWNLRKGFSSQKKN